MKKLTKILLPLFVAATTCSCISRTYSTRPLLLSKKIVREDLESIVKKEIMPSIVPSIIKKKLKIKTNKVKVEVPYRKIRENEVKLYETKIIRERHYGALYILPIIFAAAIYPFGGWAIIKKIVNKDPTTEKIIGRKETKDEKTIKIVEYPLYDKARIKEVIGPLSNERIKIVSKALGIVDIIYTNKKGIAYISLKNHNKNVIISKREFMELKEVEMFKGQCNLNNVFSRLKVKPVDFVIYYNNKKYDEEIEKIKGLIKKIYVRDRETLPEALKAEKCY